jgi:hypothetical protein
MATRQAIVRSSLIVYLILFLLSPLVLATEDGMVVYYLGLALICVAPLALATSTRTRILASAAIVLAIGLALGNWNIATERWTRRLRELYSRLAELSSTTTAPASGTTTQPMHEASHP